MTFDEYIASLPAPVPPLFREAMREGWNACMKQRDAEKESFEQAEEISRLRAVLAKCKETLVSSISDLQEPNFVTLAAWRIKEALAAIKEEGL